MSKTLNLSGYRLFSSLWVFVCTITDCRLKGADAISTVDVEGHLELGRQLLSRGQYNDALSHYHAAVEGDPTNYLTYFKRATVYHALGKPNLALEDLNKVMELKPDFLAARFQRGNILLKQGRLDEAHIDFEWVLRLDPLNYEVQRLYSSLEPLKQEIAMVHAMIQDKNYLQAIDILTRLLHELPWDVKLRELRAECFEAVGDFMNAIGDLRSTTKLRSDNTQGYLKLTKLHYELGEAEESLSMVRECLKLDPEHKQCFAHYKKVKKLASQLQSIRDFSSQGQYTECVDKANAALKTESETRRIIHFIKGKICHCLVKDKLFVEAINACTDALTIASDDASILCDRAEAYIGNEQFEEALQDYQKASRIDDSSSRAHEGEQRARKLIKQSKNRDYYKILGVRRTAGKREILKAYRKLAQKWHPDNYQGEEKKSAEKKFIDIAAAKEVLTDPEKREKFDNGEDPLDPESNAGQGFNPFAHGFHPFGHGEPFTFKFHFS